MAINQSDVPHLYILGPPRLEINAQPIQLDTRKALAMLAFLAINKQAYQRESLAALLWPELDQPRARAALRRTLTPLNQGLGAQALNTTRETVELNPAFKLWVDAQEFSKIIARARAHEHVDASACPDCLEELETGVGWYRGNFLEGFTLRDSISFDDWQFMESEQHRRKYTWALERLTEIYSHKGVLEKAIETARRWLLLDPLHEPAHRTLMRLYNEDGQRSQALRQYRDCIRILEKELGVAPLEETTSLYEAILENRLAPHPEPIRSFLRPRPPAQAVSAQDGSPPLVGREKAWQQLIEALEHSREHGRLVVIDGEIGIGKTRLATDLVDYAQTEGCRTLSARCYEGERHLAYAPINAALRSALNLPGAPNLHQSLAPVWLYEATRLLPELASPGSLPPDIGSTDPANAQVRLFEAVRQILDLLRSDHNATILFIDDLQWADTATLDLLAYLVRRLEQLPILILTAWRSENLDLDHPLSSLLSEAHRQNKVTHITPGRLTSAEVGRLIAFYNTVPDHLKDTLFDRTDGVPFFVIEYLTAGFDLSPDAIPAGVREIQQARLHGLSDTARQAIATAAVIGRSFDFDTLKNASGRSEEETITALEQLLSRGLLVEKKVKDRSSAAERTLPCYDFAHETIHKVVTEQISLARLRLLHRRIAESLIAESRGLPEFSAAVASHLQHAGKDGQAAIYFAQAGDYARNLHANAEALSHYQTALALGHSDIARLHTAIGDLRTLRGEYRQAVISYEKSASLAQSEALPQLERKLANVHHRRGDYELADSHYQAAVDLLEQLRSDSPEQALIYIDWSRTAAQQNNLPRSASLAEAGLEIARKKNGPDRREPGTQHPRDSGAETIGPCCGP